jgi:hypothetical protein
MTTRLEKLEGDNDVPRIEGRLAERMFQQRFVEVVSLAIAPLHRSHPHRVNADGT